MQKIPGKLTPRLKKNAGWVLLILLVVAIKWAALYPGFVERYYTYGLYPVISRVQRFMLGWIPFSAGDLLYGFMLVLLILWVTRLIRRVFRGRPDRHYFWLVIQRLVYGMLLVYVLFYGLWGLNYNREGIEKQLALQVRLYSVADLDTLTTVLQGELNHYAAGVSESDRDEFDKKSRLFREAKASYTNAVAAYPFLRYGGSSVKPSIFSYAGNYLGFQGYYNPFSGEAQVNTTVPRFLEPFVTTHEIAHQLGYAKENEANFVGFLACLHSQSPVVLYSMYFDMYNYAAGELYRRDSVRGKSFTANLHPQVKKDLVTLRSFVRSHRNPVETFIMWGYGNYLKANNQPGGKHTYNEVVGWLVAYYKKYGTAALVAVPTGTGQ